LLLFFSFWNCSVRGVLKGVRIELDGPLPFSHCLLSSDIALEDCHKMRYSLKAEARKKTWAMAILITSKREREKKEDFFLFF